MTRPAITAPAISLAPGHHGSGGAGRDPFPLADVSPVASAPTPPSHSVTSSSAAGPALTARTGGAGRTGPPPAPGMVTSPPRSSSAMTGYAPPGEGVPFRITTRGMGRHHSSGRYVYGAILTAPYS